MLVRRHRLEVDELGIGADGEVVVGVVDPRDAAAHPGGEVVADRPEDRGAAAGHVLAAVIADTLDDAEGA